MQTLAPEIIDGISVIPVIAPNECDDFDICARCVFRNRDCESFSCTEAERRDGNEVYFVLATNKYPLGPTPWFTSSDGSTASYYELPAGATELQDLISHRNMNAQDGEIFRAIYRKGHCPHSSLLREAKKTLFYAQAEVDRLEELEK